MNFTYRVIIEPDDKYFHAYAPALKGCHTFGKTIAEAKENIHEAILAYVESLIMDGEKVPADDSFETFQTIYTDKQKVYA